LQDKKINVFFVFEMMNVVCIAHGVILA